MFSDKICLFFLFPSPAGYLFGLWAIGTDSTSDLAEVVESYPIFNFCKCIGEDVGELIFRVDVFDEDAFMLNNFI